MPGNLEERFDYHYQRSMDILTALVIRKVLTALAKVLSGYMLLSPQVESGFPQSMPHYNQLTTQELMQELKTKMLAELEKGTADKL
jgi:hypothetical protein